MSANTRGLAKIEKLPFVNTAFGEKLRRFLSEASLIGFVIGTLATAGASQQVSAQTVPEPELPSLIDQNHVNLTTGNLSVTDTFGKIGPQREELARSDTYELKASSNNWWLGEIQSRDNVEDFTIFFNDLDGDANNGSYNISAENVRARFEFSNATKQFTPLDPTIATLENVSGTSNFTDLIYTAPNGTVYTFKATGSPTYYTSQPMAYLTKIERPNGEIFSNHGTQLSFRSSNLGYSSYPYLTNLGYTRCLSTSCPEYNATNWPGEQHDVAPIFTLSDPVTYTVGSQGNLQVVRYPWARVAFSDGDTIKANFETVYTNESGIVVGSPKRRVLSIERYGEVWTYEYPNDTTAAIQSTTVISPHGDKNKFYYDRDDNKILKHELIPYGGGTALTTEYTYSGEILTDVTYPEGNKTSYVRDAVGRIIEVRKTAKPGSSLPDMVTNYTYDACTPSNRKYCGFPRTVSDERGNVTSYTYSSTHGGVTEIESPNVAGYGIQKTNIEYGQFHAWYRNSSSSTQVKDSRAVWRKTKELTCVVATSGQDCTDGSADVQVAEYDYEQGNASTPSNINLTQTTTRAGDSSVQQTVDYTYDTWGRVATMDGPLPGTSDKVWYEYDKRNNTLRETMADPDGAGPQRYKYVRYEYNSEDQKTLEETGWTTSHSPTNRTDTPLVSTYYGYDPYGRPTTTTSLDGNAGSVSLIQASYDKSSRVECKALRMDVSTYASLPSSACTQTSGGNDRITKTVYDLYSRPYRTTRAFGTTIAINEDKDFTPNGLTSFVIDAKGNITTYEYDGHDRLTKTRFPNKSGGGSSTTDYDEWTFVVENGRATSLHATRRYRDGQVVSYQYDALSRLTLTDAPGTVDDISLTYDVFGNIGTESKNGNTLTYVWDALGRMVSEQSALGTVSYQHDAAGRRTQTNYPDGFFVSYEYAGASGVDLIIENGTTTVADFTYDELGRSTKFEFGNGVTNSFGFDQANRLANYDLVLSSDPSSDQRADFGYNAASQIVTADYTNTSYRPVLTEGVRSYGINGLNQLTDENGSPFTYDDRGNLTSALSVNYDYDVYNQLTAVDTNALEYDAAGRLARFTSSEGAVTQFLYDGRRLIAEYDGSGTLLRRYIHGTGTDDPIVWHEGGAVSDTTRRYLIADERGSIVLVTDNIGQTIQRNSYSVYGEPGSSNLGRFQYTGQMWLAGTSLYHYKARAYSPRLGRFLQTDPIGYEDGLNMYAYAGNDPVNFSDPGGTAATVAIRAANHSAKSLAIACASRGWCLGLVIGTTATIINVANDGFSDSPDDASQSGKTQPGGGEKPWTAPPDDVADKVPAEWGKGKPTKKNKKGKPGWRWQDPNDQGNSIRIDKGDPDAKWPSQRGDHVRIDSGGNVIGADGEIIEPTDEEPKPSKTEEAHIPKDEWLEWERWDKPFAERIFDPTIIEQF